LERDEDASQANQAQRPKSVVQVAISCVHTNPYARLREIANKYDRAGPIGAFLSLIKTRGEQSSVDASIA
jgi:hypothetical protein